MELASRIPEKLFFKIGEVCELIKVQPHVLRYWETEFPMLTPQKNRAGQRVYRRKDVEMVMRIRDLLYEEKFTIAGAKKKLMDEQRSGASRPQKHSVREAAHIEEPPAEQEPIAPAAAAPPVSPSSVIAPSIAESSVTASADLVPQAEAAESLVTPQAQLAIRVLKRDLEDLLTMLKSDASIRN
jgi:DNA-binding transcriptional MerR regulator